MCHSLSDNLKPSPTHIEGITLWKYLSLGGEENRSKLFNLTLPYFLYL